MNNPQIAQGQPLSQFPQNTQVSQGQQISMQPQMLFQQHPNMESLPHKGSTKDATSASEEPDKPEPQQHPPEFAANIPLPSPSPTTEQQAQMQQMQQMQQDYSSMVRAKGHQHFVTRLHFSPF